ncbi:hypothetical protein BDW22DRAFT_1142548 [Trametopsis cervina]|nr:hypothetical protein BDW22DRAFT_1142548 [Trametopsis cervina]
MPSRRSKTHGAQSSGSETSPTRSGSESDASSTSKRDRGVLNVEEATHDLEVAIDDLDESLSYPFQDGQSVWVRVDTEWEPGVISGKRTQKTNTRSSEGLAFPVAYGQRKRKYFAPLNGDIKPDTPTVRALLQEGGWLDVDVHTGSI